jgi:hypothetical protein
MSLIRSKRLLFPATLVFLGAVARPASAADPKMSECLSANEGAIKLRGEHKLRQAREQALVCAASSCPGEVRDACQKRVTELTTAIPTVVFVAKDGAGHDLVSVDVSMDGAPIGNHLDGTPIPVDPGQHTFTFKVAGQPPLEQSFVISEGQKDRRETITVGVAGTGALTSPMSSGLPSAAGGLPVSSAERPVVEQVPVSGSHGGGQRVAGIVVGAVGVVGLGLGAAFGGIAASDWSNAKAYCNGMTASCTTNPSSPGLQDEHSASTMAALSTASSIAGGVLAAAGILVIVTAPRTSSSDVPPSAQAIEFVPMGVRGGTGMMIRASF